MLDLDPKTTALILVDLQKGILARSLAPHTGSEVLARGLELSERFRAAKAPVVRTSTATTWCSWKTRRRVSPPRCTSSPSGTSSRAWAGS